MQEDKHIKAKRAAGTWDDSGWRPGGGQLLGLMLCGLLLLAAIILGVTTGIGLVFAVPLAVVALVVALVMFRGKVRKAAGTCPHCGAAINFPSHIAEFDCPACGNRVESRGQEAADWAGAQARQRPGH